MKQKKIIAIIPARGGSKGIPRKNIRLLAGKPLIAYSIETALNSKYIDKVVVSTEDEEIEEIATHYGADVIKRPEVLAQDDTILDPVIYHALQLIENKENYLFDFVITLQPTSPLLTIKTIENGIRIMLDNDYDTLISVKNETHLYWRKEYENFIPLFNERKNRQYLDPIYVETGALLISKREIITDNSRIGNNLFLFEVPREESIDIDTYHDWLITENQLKRLTIVIRVDGQREIGLGHVYRMITLASKMAFNNNVIFLMDEKKELGINKVNESNLSIITFENDVDLFKKITELNPDIIINDILETEKEYILNLMTKNIFIVNFEDLGEGSELANIVINALYENSNPPTNHYYGYKYVCLRDEFFIAPSKEIKKEVRRILITFGGTDPNDLSLRTLKAIKKLDLKHIFIKLILGLGYRKKQILCDYATNLKKEGFSIEIEENVKFMSKEIYLSDIIITSNGRTVYEVASIGVPCISISQNSRETKHLFTYNSRSIIDLGIANTVSENDIAHEIKKLVDDFELRKNIHDKLSKIDLKKGTDRVLRLIYREFDTWNSR